MPSTQQLWLSIVLLGVVMLEAAAWSCDVTLTSPTRILEPSCTHFWTCCPGISVPFERKCDNDKFDNAATALCRLGSTTIACAGPEAGTSNPRGAAVASPTDMEFCLKQHGDTSRTASFTRPVLLNVLTDGLDLCFGQRLTVVYQGQATSGTLLVPLWQPRTGKSDAKASGLAGLKRVHTPVALRVLSDTAYGEGYNPARGVTGAATATGARHMVLQLPDAASLGVGQAAVGSADAATHGDALLTASALDCFINLATGTAAGLHPLRLRLKNCGGGGEDLSAIQQQVADGAAAEDVASRATAVPAAADTAATAADTSTDVPGILKGQGAAASAPCTCAPIAASPTSCPSSHLPLALHVEGTSPAAGHTPAFKPVTQCVPPPNYDPTTHVLFFEYCLRAACLGPEAAAALAAAAEVGAEPGAGPVPVLAATLPWGEVHRGEQMAHGSAHMTVRLLNPEQLEGVVVSVNTAVGGDTHEVQEWGEGAVLQVPSGGLQGLALHLSAPVAATVRGGLVSLVLTTQVSVNTAAATTTSTQAVSTDGQAAMGPGDETAAGGGSISAEGRVYSTQAMITGFFPGTQQQLSDMGAVLGLGASAHVSSWTMGFTLALNATGLDEPCSEQGDLLADYRAAVVAALGQVAAQVPIPFPSDVQVTCNLHTMAHHTSHAAAAISASARTGDGARNTLGQGQEAASAGAHSGAWTDSSRWQAGGLQGQTAEDGTSSWRAVITQLRALIPTSQSAATSSSSSPSFSSSILPAWMHLGGTAAGRAGQVGGCQGDTPGHGCMVFLATQVQLPGPQAAKQAATAATSAAAAASHHRTADQAASAAAVGTGADDAAGAREASEGLASIPAVAESRLEAMCSAHARCLGVFAPALIQGTLVQAFLPLWLSASSSGGSAADEGALANGGGDAAAQKAAQHHLHLIQTAEQDCVSVHSGVVARLHAFFPAHTVSHVGSPRCTPSPGTTHAAVHEPVYDTVLHGLTTSLTSLFSLPLVQPASSPRAWATGARCLVLVVSVLGVAAAAFVCTRTRAPTARAAAKGRRSAEVDAARIHSLAGDQEVGLYQQWAAGVSAGLDVCPAGVGDATVGSIFTPPAAARKPMDSSANGLPPLAVNTARSSNGGGAAPAALGHPFPHDAQLPGYGLLPSYSAPVHHPGPTADAFITGSAADGTHAAVTTTPLLSTTGSVVRGGAVMHALQSLLRGVTLTPRGMGTTRGSPAAHHEHASDDEDGGRCSGDGSKGVGGIAGAMQLGRSVPHARLHVHVQHGAEVTPAGHEALRHERSSTGGLRSSRNASPRSRPSSPRGTINTTHTSQGRGLEQTGTYSKSAWAALGMPAAGQPPLLQPHSSLSVITHRRVSGNGARAAAPLLLAAGGSGGSANSSTCNSPAGRAREGAVSGVGVSEGAWAASGATRTPTISTPHRRSVAAAMQHQHGDGMRPERPAAGERTSRLSATSGHPSASVLADTLAFQRHTATAAAAASLNAHPSVVSVGGARVGPPRTQLLSPSHSTGKVKAQLISGASAGVSSQNQNSGAMWVQSKEDKLQQQSSARPVRTRAPLGTLQPGSAVVEQAVGGAGQHARRAGWDQLFGN